MYACKSFQHVQGSMFQITNLNVPYVLLGFRLRCALVIQQHCLGFMLALESIGKWLLIQFTHVDLIYDEFSPFWVHDLTE